MEEKIYIEFDLGNEEMIRQAINMPELYEDFLVSLLYKYADQERERREYTDEFMIIQSF